MALGRISGEMLEQNLNLTRNLTFNDDALTITTDGKIGIKNNNPGVELDVTGTARANTLTVLGDLSMEWTISMDAQDTLNFAYNNNLTMSLATNGALLLNGIGLDTIGSGQKVFTASGSISAGDVVRLNANGTVSAGISIIDNPNAYNTSAGDYFGYNVAISESYAIVGAYNEDDAGGTSSGKAYIFDTITGNLLYTLDNPNAYDTSADDRFGDNVAISESYAIVGAYPEDDAGGTHSGKAYIYSTSTGNLLYTLDNPNDFDTSQNDQFGFSVAISESYAIVGALAEDDPGGTDSGKAYIFDTSTGNLLYTLDNPNAYNTLASDLFSRSVAISESYAIVGTWSEDDAGGLGSGKAYIYNLVILSNWIGIAAEDIADTATGIIDLPGAINRSQTGLTTNSIYYVDVNGSLTTTPTTFGMIGKAISTTDLQIFGNAVIEFSKAIDVDFTTNTPTTTSGLVLTSDGDSSYSFQNSIDISGAIAANSLQSYFVKEYANIVATSSTIVVADITTTGTVVYMTADMTGDTTVNVRGDASTTLDDLLAVNESVTVVFLFTTGATAYINNILEIDNQSRTVKWNGGSAPTAGTANAIDVYSYTIIKTAANTYTVLGSFSSFA